MQHCKGAVTGDILALTPDLGGKASCFSPFNTMLTEGVFGAVLYQVEKVTYNSLFTDSFVTNGCWILSNAFSVCTDRIT